MVKRETLIMIAGSVWVAIGLMLMILGITFLMKTLNAPIVESADFSILQAFSSRFPSRYSAALMAICSALVVGYLKGRVMLKRSVNRQLRRIETLPERTSLKNIYSPGFYILIGCMITLGISLKYWPITLDTRGTVDLAIGAALINGSMHFFNYLQEKRKEEALS